MRTILFFFLLVLTGVRLVDLIYLLTKTTTNLPAIVFVFAGILIAYGILLIVKKLVRGTFLRDFKTFFLVDALLTGISLLYVVIKVPLQLTFSETILVGSFLNIVLDLCIVYTCQRRINQQYISVDINLDKENHND